MHLGSCNDTGLVYEGMDAAEGERPVLVIDRSVESPSVEWPLTAVAVTRIPSINDRSQSQAPHHQSAIAPYLFSNLPQSTTPASSGAQRR